MNRQETIRPSRIQEFGLGWLLLALAALVFLVWGPVMGTYADYLWFSSLGYRSVFTKTLALRLLAALAAASFVFAVLYVNGRIASHYTPPVRLYGRIRHPAWEQLSLFFSVLEKSMQRVVFGLALAGGIFAATLAHSHWEEVALFASGLPFARKDPAYGRDLGLYLFRLPLLDAVWDGIFWTLIAALAVALIIYSLRAAMEAFVRQDRFPPYVKNHLSIIVAALLLWRALGFVLDALHLVYAPVRVAGLASIASGAGYTDWNIRRPLLYLLAVLCLGCAAYILLNFRRASIRPVLYVVGVVIVLSIVSNFLLAAIVQPFIRGNEKDVEKPFLARSIEMTRLGYGIEAIDRRNVPLSQARAVSLKQTELEAIREIRIWDHRALVKTVQQQQQIRPYYRVNHVDSDRYHFDGGYRQVALCARELSPENVPQKSWVNQHTQYTHGYGAIVASATRTTADGKPIYLLSNIPPRGNEAFRITEPGIYFGEQSNEGLMLPYVLVNLRTPEIDYSAETGTQKTVYRGKRGIRIDSWISRAALATTLFDWYLLTTRQVQTGSQLLWRRDVHERVRTLAPFLRYDLDAYLVIADGKLYWILDAYTTSDYLPYSKPDMLRYTSEGKPNPLYRANYLRNSVKAVINAYSGETRFYIVDEADPVIKTWQRIFPGLFRSAEEMPDALTAHLRYPIDLFRSQARTHAFYHMTEPSEFYELEDRWDIAREVISNDRQPEGMEPYYVMTELPGSDKPEFVLMIPFEPYTKQVMSGWFAARCDGERRGQLFAFHFPKGSQVYGPMQFEAAINTDRYVAEKLTLWDQLGSRVIRGHLLVLPLKDLLLYVKPIYLEATQTEIPELKMVVAATGASARLQWGDSLGQALAKEFGSQAYALLEGRDAPVPTLRSGRVGTGKPPPAVAALPHGEAGVAEDANVPRLVKRAQTLYENLQSSSRSGDWKAFGDTMKQLGATLEDLSRKSAGRASAQHPADRPPATNSKSVGRASRPPAMNRSEQRAALP